MPHLTSELRKWIDDNLAQGADKDTVFKVLFDDGIAFKDIELYMGYTPSIPLENIHNPVSQANNHSYGTIPQGVLFLPNARECIEDESRLLCVDEFLNQQELSSLSELLSQTQLSATMVDELSDVRQGYNQLTYDLNKLNSELIKEIDQRICRFIGLDPICGSELYFQSVSISHTGSIASLALDMSVFTVVIYLSNGHTHFPNLATRLGFRSGDLVLWQNKQPDGGSDEQMCYTHSPMVGQKQQMLIKRFELNNNTLAYRKTLNEMVQNYTQLGIKKIKLDNELFNTLIDFYHNNKKTEVEEFDGEDDFIKGDATQKTPSSLLNLPDELCTYIHCQMQPILETWTGVELEPTYVYGIRTYHNTATLEPHRDRIATHIISCIINVYQDVDEDWSLQIEDNYYRKHSISFEPGEAVLYESARLEHSRIEPLKGKAYANIFCHFMPKGYVPPEFD